jgi:hypothetical protein
VWKIVRICVLLLILVWAAAHTWLDRVASTGWKQTLWVGVFPVNADGSATAQRYIDGLQEKDFAGIEDFFAREAHRYGKDLSLPVHIALYPQRTQRPPQLERDAGLLATMLWSLKLRWYAARAADIPGRAPPRVRLFVLFHDPSTLQIAPDSHGLQKGLMGVVHVFALPAMAGSNNIVIAHELMHTLGASDRYDPRTGAPLFPGGFAEPDRQPLYPQSKAEIMAGRLALSAQEFEMPRSLTEVVVGPQTAAQIRWTHR